MVLQVFRHIQVPCLVLLLAVSLIGCRSDRVAVDPKDPQSPKYAYRLDELALLQLAADDIQELERKKEYGKIYDNFASDGFKAGVSRRRFLIMANCVEINLGGLLEFDRNDLDFRREYVNSQKGKQPLDVLNRQVQRTKASIEEQLVFVGNGLNFKLNGLYWIAKDKQFLQCIAESPQVEAKTAPKSETAQTPSDDAHPADETAAETATDQPAASDTAPNDTKPDTASTDQPPAGESQSGGPPLPVQEMKPQEERKKEPLQARPAGAGAVVDTRPAAKIKKPAKPSDAAKKTSDSGASGSNGSAPVPAAEKPSAPVQDETPSPKSPPTPDNGNAPTPE